MESEPASEDSAHFFKTHKVNGSRLWTDHSETPVLHFYQRNVPHTEEHGYIHFLLGEQRWRDLTHIFLLSILSNQMD